MQQQIIGVALIIGGIFFGIYAVRNRGDRGIKDMDTYIFIRTMSGSITLIFIGIMMLLKKW